MRLKRLKFESKRLERLDEPEMIGYWIDKGFNETKTNEN